MGNRKRSVIAGVAAIILIAIPILFSLLSGTLVHWLWMDNLGFETIFLRTLLLKASVFIASFAFVFLFSWVNIGTAVKHSFREKELVVAGQQNTVISPQKARLIAIIGSLIFSVLFALILMNQWSTLLEFFWRESIRQTDPIYHMDLMFYFFELPFYNLLQNSLVTLFLIALVTVLLIYFSLEKIPLESSLLTFIERPILIHITILSILFVITLGAGYLLDRYALLFSTRGVVSGMGYVDYTIVRPSLTVMFFASLVLAAAIALTVYVKRIGYLIAALGIFLLLSLFSLGIVPAFTQKYIVRPNELDLERQYIEYNILMTRKAYGLDRIRERSYSAVDDLTQAELADNEETIINIRLWDWRPILQTYNQTQAIRLYYQFYEVDVGRYNIPGEGYRQVMLSARELAEELPEKARTWVNSNLQFTHGYGLVMSTVSEFLGEGFPRYVIEDIPPVSTGLKVDRPALYYAERTPGYRIVNTRIMELDYPKGDTNSYTSYQGSGGILLDSIWKKVLFAWDTRDINILISRYLKPESRIQLWRNISQRVTRIAPFFVLDKDPYLVLSEGRLYWIQDAYTISRNYPYSESIRGELNYIRNSVKVVMDAYDGSTGFYIFDPEDPVIRVYSRAFPGVFKGMNELPEHLKGHVRYPEDLFTIQADMYRTYHMTVPQVFYNREDLWAFPRENYQGKPGRMEPYYVLIRLPDEKDLQYIMMMPLTPQNRNNMIAWMASRSDFPWYGEIIVYKLPKDRIVYGPVQIEAMINQDTLISQQLSLWDQRGSQVIRGNLLVIPINTSFLYVEPVYILAEGANIPQLKRVIMVYGGKVVMEASVQDALNAIFGMQPPRRPGIEAVTPRPDGLPRPGAAVLDLMQDAENALRQGNWTDFGRAMDKLKAHLSQPGQELTPQ